MKNIDIQKIRQLLNRARRPGINVLIDQALTLLPCETCGDSGRDPTFDQASGLADADPCPDCQKPEQSKNDLLPMPKEWIGKIYNACTVPCDMLYGPCVCGAWHHFDEWIITRKKLTAKGWVEPDCQSKPCEKRGG